MIFLSSVLRAPQPLPVQERLDYLHLWRYVGWLLGVEVYGGCEGDTQTLGKGVGNDARKGKITYPSILGLDKSKEIQRAMIKGAVESLESFDDRADPLRDIAQYIIERKK